MFVRREGDLDLEVIELALDEDMPMEVRNHNLQNMIGFQLNSYHMLFHGLISPKELSPCCIYSVVSYFGGRCNGAS